MHSTIDQPTQAKEPSSHSNETLTQDWPYLTSDDLRIPQSSLRKSFSLSVYIKLYVTFYDRPVCLKVLLDARLVAHMAHLKSEGLNRERKGLSSPI